MNVKKTLFKIWSFYYQGFKEMTLGRILWAIILLKLFVCFLFFESFSFPIMWQRMPMKEKRRSLSVRNWLKGWLPIEFW